VAPTRESRLPSCAFAEAALLLRDGDGGKKQVAAALIPAPPSPPNSLTQGHRRRVILFAHGNAVDLAQQLPFLRELSNALARGGAPVAIACFDYQGYGESKKVVVSESGEEDGDGERNRAAATSSSAASCTCGAPSSSSSSLHSPVCPDHGPAPDCSTADALLDGAAALRWLLEEKGFQPQEVLLYGQSLGSGVATSLAVAMSERERRRAKAEESKANKNKNRSKETASAPASSPSPPCLAAAGLLLHSPLASGLRVLKPGWRWWPSALDIFPVARAASKMYSSPSSSSSSSSSRTTKCLVIHGDADDVVPFENGRAVFDALPPEARVAPLWVSGGGHCDLEGKAVFLPRLLKFLKEEI